MITLQFTDATPAIAAGSKQSCEITLVLQQWLSLWCALARVNRVAIAYSGGLDSSVLVHAFAKLTSLPCRLIGETSARHDIELIHVDHGLNAASSEWADHCRQFATALGFDITVLKVQVHLCGTGLEDAARRARYRAIAEHTGPDVLLLTAHHQLDQAETVLMKILSGAGPRGAVAMNALSVRRDFLLGRPLLTIAKSQICAYAERHRLSWVVDPSNTEAQFQRNRLRRLLPDLSALYPDAVKNLGKFAAQSRLDRALLEAQAARGLARCLTLDARVLAISPLHLEQTALRPWILRAWLARFDVHSPELEKATLALAHGTNPAVQATRQTTAVGEARVVVKKTDHSGAQDTFFVRRFNDCLYFEKQKEVPAPFAPCTWHAHTPLNLPGFGSLSFERLSDEVASSVWLVHQRRGGERMQLPGRLGNNGRAHSTAIKDILQQQRIPPWQRKRLILLAYSDTGEIACVVGICTSARFSAWLLLHTTRLVHNN